MKQEEIKELLGALYDITIGIGTKMGDVIADVIEEVCEKINNSKQIENKNKSNNN